jgi:hypothetical protein
MNRNHYRALAKAVKSAADVMNGAFGGYPLSEREIALCREALREIKPPNNSGRRVRELPKSTSIDLDTSIDPDILF